MSCNLSDQNGSGSTPGGSGLDTRCTVNDIVAEVKSTGLQGPATSDSTLTECGKPVNSSSVLANASSICATDTAASDDSIPMDRDSFKRMIHFLMVIFAGDMTRFEITEECYWRVLKDYDAQHLRERAYQIGKMGDHFPLPREFHPLFNIGGAV